jgi:hypothetical protein
VGGIRRPRQPRDLALISAIAIVALDVAAACSDSSTAALASDAGVPAESGAGPLPEAAPPAEAAAPLDCATDRGPDGLATHLSCADLYADITTKTVAADTRPFTPALEFWSDGAVKQRYVRLPSGSTIDISNFDDWRFPVGTRLWKEFKVEGTLVETRLFAKTDGGWKHTAYRWNAQATDAVRQDTGERIDLPGRTPYEVPNSDQCDFCHAGRVEPVLGFQALGLGLAAAKGVTLATLASEGALAPAPPTTTLAIPDDATKLAVPALGWLHANCGHCHNDNPKAGAYGASLKMLIRPSELVGDGGVTSADGLAAYRTGYCKPSERDAPAGGYYLYISGGSVNDSVAALLLGSRATPGQESILTQMPPILTHVVDTVGQKHVDDWITALPPCP